MVPELIADTRCIVGEGPLWHEQEGALYWVDIPEARIFKYDPQSNTHEEFYRTDGMIGGFTIQTDGSLLLFMDRGAIRILKDGVLSTILEEIPEERNSRFNDVIADPLGRVFCGTMPTKEAPGRLYRLDTDTKLTLLEEGIHCSNGMGFTPDQKHLYYTDSLKREIYIFDYERDTGEIRNRRIFVTTPEGEGIPDGMTVDSEGFVWSARWDGGILVRYSPDGGEVERVEFPAMKVSSAIFGGEGYRDLYVTTAGGNNREREGKGAGAVFRLRPRVPGIPEFRSRISSS